MTELSSLSQLTALTEFTALNKQTIQFVRQGIFRNARLIDPSQNLDALGIIEVRNGYIYKITKSDDAGYVSSSDRVLESNWEVDLDLEGHILCPSFVDIGCSIPEPGYEQKGTLESELSAAAEAGYSHIGTLPNTLPVADSPAVIALIMELAQGFPGIQVMPFGALTQGLQGEQISELFALKTAGCVGVTNTRREIPNQRVLMNCLEYASTHDLLVCFCSEANDLASDGCAHQGATAARLGLPGIPSCAETVAIARDLLLVEHTGVRAHFSQVSSARSVELIAAAQERGLSVTADVGMPYLCYTDESVTGFNPQFHVRPPFRTEVDRLGLIEGLRSRTLTAITSAHAPHERAAKAAPFADTEAGMSTLSTQVHWANQLVKEGLLSWSDWVQGMTGGAKVFDLDVGHLKVGSRACFTVIDPQREWLFEETSCVSHGKNNPLLGQKLEGKVQFQVRGLSH